MKVAVVRESREGEARVAVVPAGVKSLVKGGLAVTVETGAGSASGATDEEYVTAGATIAGNAAEALAAAEMLLHINPPTPEELSLLPSGCVVVSFLNPLGDAEGVAALARAGVTAVSMEMVPRITRAQSMDALSSQATVAGYKAVLMAAGQLPKFLPMFTTAAGTIRPAKALVLGAGVAGLQAIATARRLGAVVEAFDVRPAVKEQVESLGASFLEAEEEVAAEGEGGYAAELSEDQHEKELALIASAISTADIVITTAQIPGRPAPLLITDDMLRSMKAGSVVVDLASESGGNCSGTEAGTTCLVHGVQIMAPLNIPASIPVHASQMYSKNIVTLVGEFVDEDGALALDMENDVVGPATVAHGGEVTNDRIRSALSGGA